MVTRDRTAEGKVEPRRVRESDIVGISVSRRPDIRPSGWRLRSTVDG
jgi:hypothetical protein